MAANWWYRRGGLGGVMFDEAHGLESRGCEVIPFAAAHPQNEPTPWSRHFPSFTETAQAGAQMSLLARAGAAFDLIHDREAARCFASLIAEVRPDVLHLHGPGRQLSPSIIAVAVRHRIPVVITLHDYALICPQGRLLKGEVAACTPPNCVRGNVVHAVTNRCLKQSTAASAVAALEHLVHRATGAYTRRAARFVAPSRFLARAVTSAGVEARRVAVLPNGLEPGASATPLPNEGGHLLYAGRLAGEKGLATLVEAARRLPDATFILAGDGPLKRWLQAEAPPNVSLVGHQPPQELEALRRGAVAVISPSIWYENAPLTVLEAMRAARPVVATDIGGQPELLESGGGLLVPPGDATALVGAIDRLWADRSEAAAIGRAGRQALVERYSLDRHLDGLLAIYEEVTAQPGGPPASHRTGRGNRPAPPARVA